MSLPGNALSSVPVPSAFIGGQALSTPRTEDHETGAGALNDPSLGMFYQMWNTRIVNDKIYISADNTPEYLWYDGTSVTDVSIAFDQNMRLYMAYRDLDVTYFYWYNSQTAQHETMNLGTNCLTPKISLDDKRATQSGGSDIILAYVKSGKLYFREQRERFQTEHLLADGPFVGLNKMGMGSGMRFQFLLTPFDTPDT